VAVIISLRRRGTGLQSAGEDHQAAQSGGCHHSAREPGQRPQAPAQHKQGAAARNGQRRREAAQYTESMACTTHRPLDREHLGCKVAAQLLATQLECATPERELLLPPHHGRRSSASRSRCSSSRVAASRDGRD